MSTKITSKENFEKIELALASEIANDLLDKLNPLCQRAIIAGSIRRNKANIGDLDFVLIPKDPDTFFNEVKNIIDFEYGATKKVFGLYRDRPINLFITTPESYGACLYQCTGPATYNIRKRCLVKGRGFKLNEYGLFDKVDNRQIAGDTEESIFDAMGWKFKKPEERI
jgi:DNA polymerase (family 10)